MGQTFPLLSINEPWKLKVQLKTKNSNLKQEITPAPTYFWIMLDKFLRWWKKALYIGWNIPDIPKHIFKNILSTPQTAEIVKYFFLLLHFFKGWIKIRG